MYMMSLPGQGWQTFVQVHRRSLPEIAIFETLNLGCDFHLLGFSCGTK
jgi:hypothetical protein